MTSRRATARPSDEPRRRPDRPRAHGVALALVPTALALAGLAGLWVYSGQRATGVNELRRGGVVEISAAVNRIRRRIALPGSNGVELGMGGAWVTGPVDSGAGVTRIDTSRARRDQAIALGPETATIPDDLAVGEGAVWVILAGGVYRVDPARPTAGRKVQGLPAGSLLSGVAAGAGAVWVVDATRGTLNRVSPASGSVTDVIPVGPSAETAAVGEGAVWVTSVQGMSVLEISPTLRRVVRAIPLGSAPTGIAVGAGSIWVTASERDAVARVEPSSNRVTWITVDEGPTGVSVTGRTVWVASSEAGSVSRIDADRGAVVARLPVPDRPYRIAADGQAVWVTALGRPVRHDHRQPAA
jgi:streptogramin lyase